MTFDPRSLEHLQVLGRQLPQELPKPSSTEKKERGEKSNSHPIETEQNPQALFQELINASPDGNVPSHLISRLKEIETKQLNPSNNHCSKKTSDTNKKEPKVSSKKLLKKETEQQELYASFDRFLLED